jgi:signal transduction histidine kinase
MKEVIFDRPPRLGKKEQRIADLHSLFNILNVISGEISLIEFLVPSRASELGQLEKEVFSLVEELRENDLTLALIQRVSDFEAPSIRLLSSIAEANEVADLQDDLEEGLANLKSIYAILDERLEEFKLRAEQPNACMHLSIDAFRQQFQSVFGAIEKNAKGRYHIVFNLARKGLRDYYVDLNIESSLADGMLWIPLQLTDVLRDLTANARKYTLPGGKVALALYQDAEMIRCVIEDSGCGIPEDELEKVVEFGYRASNVIARPTMGGGFGLTKAIWLICEWGGQLAIASELGVGTKISINIPTCSFGTASSVE